QSTWVRFELWKASWLMMLKDPWVGNAAESFSDKLIILNKQGLISDEATWKKGSSEAFVQPHNEFANAIANRGVLGAAALLALYLAPISFFVRRRPGVLKPAWQPVH